MSVTTTYPGIYLTENTSLYFSISTNDTAVPAFLTDASQQGLPSSQYTRFNSWIDVRSAIPDEYTDEYYYNALFFWFSQGGGSCYLLDKNSLQLNIIPDDVTLIVANGQTSTAIENFDRYNTAGKTLFTLFDSEDKKISLNDDVAVTMQNYPVSACAAVFYPWVTTDWARQAIPPSVIAAVAIAKADLSYGVWKAPANITINDITPKYPVSDDLQGRFNQGKALNMIRTFPDKGTVLWGMRTLEDSDHWRYIPVRRLFSMVERDIQKTLNKCLFEPNSEPVWQQVKAAVNNYLYPLWQQGALMGSKETDAWFVQMGKDITMTTDDISQGKMIIKIGLAAVRPAEFIILQFTQDMGQ